MEGIRIFRCVVEVLYPLAREFYHFSLGYLFSYFVTKIGEIWITRALVCCCCRANVSNVLDLSISVDRVNQCVESCYTWISKS